MCSVHYLNKEYENESNLEPGMFEGLSRCEPTGGDDTQQFGDQILTLCCHRLPRARRHLKYKVQLY